MAQGPGNFPKGSEVRVCGEIRMCRFDFRLGLL